MFEPVSDCPECGSSRTCTESTALRACAKCGDCGHRWNHRRLQCPTCDHDPNAHAQALADAREAAVLAERLRCADIVRGECAWVDDDDDKARRRIDRVLERIAALPPDQDTDKLPSGYDRDAIWRDVEKGLRALPDLRTASWQTIIVRMDGEEQYLEADWLKYLQLVMVHYPPPDQDTEPKRETPDARFALVGPTMCTHLRKMDWGCYRCGRPGPVDTEQGGGS